MIREGWLWGYEGEARGRGESVYEQIGFNDLVIMNSNKCRFNDPDLSDIFEDPGGLQRLVL